MPTKKKTTKKTGEALRKEAIAEVESNIAKLEAGEQTRAKTKKPAGKSNVAKPVKTPSTPRKAAKGSGVTGLDAAANVLSAFKEPLSANDIAKRAIEAGWKTNGRTPGATLHAAISREIRDKGRESRFKKAGRGLFAANK